MSLPEFEILYEEGPCLAVCKPAGLLTQAPPGIDSLEWRIKEFIKQREGKTGNLYLGVPHRLDRPVSGAIVFARHSRAARRLAEQFEGRLVRKVYWACVQGDIEPAEGTWTDLVRKIPDQPRAEIVPDGHPEGRLAVLHYRLLTSGPGRSCLEVELETGRMHQIRVQAAARGHPLLGDAMYGSAVPFGPQHDDWRRRAIALHARSLGFRHPMTREPVTVIAAAPEPWQGVLGTGY